MRLSCLTHLFKAKPSSRFQFQLAPIGHTFLAFCPQMETPTNQAAFVPAVLGSVVTDRADIKLFYYFKVTKRLI